MKGLFSGEMNKLSWVNKNVIKTSNRPSALMKTDVKSHIEAQVWMWRLSKQGDCSSQAPWLLSSLQILLLLSCRIDTESLFISIKQQEINQWDGCLIGHLLLQTTLSRFPLPSFLNDSVLGDENSTLFFLEKSLISFFPSAFFVLLLPSRKKSNVNHL